MSYDLKCTKCGEIGNGEWHQPMCDESYYQCKCGRWWYPELLESEPEKKSFDQFERGKKEILSNLYQMQTELIGPGNVWLKQKLEETIDLLLAISVTKSDKKEIDRKSELLTRHRICARCGKQLSKEEYVSVHTCFDEQAMKENEKTKTAK